MYSLFWQMVPIRETFAQLTYNQLHPIFSPVCSILKFVRKISTAYASNDCFTVNTSNEQLSAICPMVQRRQTTLIHFMLCEVPASYNAWTAHSVTVSSVFNCSVSRLISFCLMHSWLSQVINVFPTEWEHCKNIYWLLYCIFVLTAELTLFFFQTTSCAKILKVIKWMLCFSSVDLLSVVTYLIIYPCRLCQHRHSGCQTCASKIWVWPSCTRFSPQDGALVLLMPLCVSAEMTVLWAPEESATKTPVVLFPFAISIHVYKLET